MTTDLTVEDILRRVVEAGRHVKSYQRASHRVTTKGGEQTETKSVDIRVGDDLYESSETNDCMCQEELTYRGKKYARISTDSLWQSPEELGWFTVAEGTLKADGLPEWDRFLFSKDYDLDFNPYLGAVRLPDEVYGGRRAIRLATTSNLPLDMPAFDEMMEKMLPGRAQIQDPEGKLDQFREQFSMLPDAMDLKEDLLIDASDLQVARSGIRRHRVPRRQSH